MKMRQYGLSKTKLVNLIYKPERVEKGIAPGTVAVMKDNKLYSKVGKPSLRQGYGGKGKPAGEIWLMYKDVKDMRKIISAWRYPGVSKTGENIPVPQDILKELLNNGTI